MPFEAILERQAALMSGACRLSLREVDCSAQAIEATEAAALERLALLFAPKLKVAHATLGDGGRSVRLEKDGRALLGAVSPMVELVVQQCTRPDYCYIGAALPGKGALSSFLGVDDESWGYTGDGVFRGDGRIKHKDSYVQSGLPTYKAGDRIRMTLAGGVPRVAQQRPEGRRGARRAERRALWRRPRVGWGGRGAHRACLGGGRGVVPRDAAAAVRSDCSRGQRAAHGAAGRQRRVGRGRRRDARGGAGRGVVVRTCER